MKWNLRKNNPNSFQTMKHSKFVIRKEPLKIQKFFKTFAIVEIKKGSPQEVFNIFLNTFAIYIWFVIWVSIYNGHSDYVHEPNTKMLR